MDKKEAFIDNLKNYEKPVQENKKDDKGKIPVDKNKIYGIKNSMEDDLKTMQHLINSLIDGTEEDRIPIAKLLEKKLQDMQKIYNAIEEINDEARVDDENNTRNEQEAYFKE